MGEQERLVRGWLELQEHWWAHAALHDVCESDPELAWSVILDVLERTSSREILEVTAAGPFEDLLRAHGERLIARLEVAVASNPRLREAVRIVRIPPRGDDITRRLVEVGCIELPQRTTTPRRVGGLATQTGDARPGQVEPNEFEQAILRRISMEDELSPQLRPESSARGSSPGLHVLSREFTGVGCFTNFRYDDAAAESGGRHIGLNALIVMPGVPNGMGAVLFVASLGQPKFLEVFTCGSDRWDGIFDGFVIEELPNSRPEADRNQKVSIRAMMRR